MDVTHRDVITVLRPDVFKVEYKNTPCTERGLRSQHVLRYRPYVTAGNVTVDYSKV